MIRTEYRPIYLGEMPWREDGHGVAKYRILDVDQSVKVFLSLLVLSYMPFAVFAVEQFTPASAFLAIAVFGLLNGFLLSRIWFYVTKGWVAPQSRGLNDEVDEVYGTFQQLAKARELIPEGSGMIDRIDEFGRLAYHLLYEVDRLPDVKAKQSTAYRIKDDIRTEMRQLINSGDELMDLIATQRSVNTKEAISHLGIDAYAENISLATAAFRALESGEKDDEIPKKIIVGGKQH